MLKGKNFNRYTIFLFIIFKKKQKKTTAELFACSGFFYDISYFFCPNWRWKSAQGVLR